MSYQELAEQSAVYAMRIIELERINADLIDALQQSLQIIDAYRHTTLGEGDFAAMYARSVLAKAKATQ